MEHFESDSPNWAWMFLNNSVHRNYTLQSTSCVQLGHPGWVGQGRIHQCSGGFIKAGIKTIPTPGKVSPYWPSLAGPWPCFRPRPRTQYRVHPFRFDQMRSSRWPIGSNQRLLLAHLVKTKLTMTDERATGLRNRPTVSQYSEVHIFLQEVAWNSCWKLSQAAANDRKKKIDVCFM